MLLEKLEKRHYQEKTYACLAVDICETGEDVILRVDMPGADPKTLHLELQGEQLTISGYRGKDRWDKKYRVLSQERVSDVRYKRTFEINSEIDCENIAANYENGILEVILKKVKSGQFKEIEINNG